ncbi:WD40-repeat-containing domain protein [Mycena floridula]|nr:WD40-repeat-containing domain protein [Mycena floridula]
MKKRIQALRRWTPGRRSKQEDVERLAPSTSATADAMFLTAGPSQRAAPPEFRFQMEGSQLTVGKGDVNSHNTVNQNIINNITTQKDDGGETLRKIDKLLEPNLAPHARLISHKKLEGCYQGTRQEILRRIELWISGNESDRRCLCIVGVPGSGKSTIAATVIRTVLETEGVFLAEFFIGRGVVETADFNNIFPTIAQQLSQLSRTMASVIQEALTKRPTLVHLIYNSQIEELLLAPLRAITNTVVIVIDALDELIEPARFSQFLAHLIPILPSNARLLLSTRNEHDILVHLDPMITKISLELHVSDSVDDVNLYIMEKLRDNLRLRFMDDEEWKDWPSALQIKLLCDHAAGLFVWGATAVSHITQVIYEEGLSGCDEALAEVNSLGMEGIDTLYRIILRRLLPLSNTSAKWEYIHRIIGLLVVSQVPLNLGTIGRLLDITPQQFDIKYFMQRARSIFVPGLARVGEDTVPQMHKSFVDFITSPRAEELQIHEPYHHGLVLHCALKSLEGLHFNMGKLESSYLPNRDVKDLKERLVQIPTHIWYSCHHWPQHLVLMGREDSSLLAAFKHFMEICFLFWLEVLSLSGSLSIAAPSMKTLAEWLDNLDQPLKLFAQDAARFAASNAQCMAHSAAHIYISALPLSPSSSIIANHYLAQYPGTLLVLQGRKENWDAALLLLNAHNETVKSVAFSPDGKHFVSGGEYGTMCIWDAGTGGLFAWCKGHTKSILSMAFSPGGECIVSGSWDHTICIWDAHSGNLIAGPFRGHHYAVTSVAFSHNGNHVVSGSRDETVIVWSVETGEVSLGPLKGHTEAIVAVAFSSDGSHVIAAAVDNSVRIWSAHHGELTVGPLFGPRLPGDVSFNFPVPAAISYDGKHIASTFDGGIYIWEAETGCVIQHFKFKGYWTSVGFSQDGSHIVTATLDEVLALDLHSGLVVGGPFDHHAKSVASVAFFPNGQHIVVGCKEGDIQVWDISGDTSHSQSHAHTSAVEVVAFSPDGEAVVSGSKTLQLWDTETGVVLAGPFKHSSQVKSLAFSPDGNCLALGLKDGKILLQEIKTGKVVWGPFWEHTGSVCSIAFSSDGLQITSACSDDNIWIWDAQTGKKIHQRYFKRPVLSVTFSSDGQHIALASGIYRNIEIFDMMTAAVTAILVHVQAISSMAFSAAGNHIVSGSEDMIIRLWDIMTGDLVRCLEGHTNVVSSITFSPDGKWVVSGSEDCTVRIWDVATDNTSAVLLGHTKAVISIQLSPDGTHLVSGSDDRTLRIWDFSGIVRSIAATADVESSIQYEDSSEMVDGWIMTLEGSLLFWVPPVYRANLWRPSNTAVIGDNALHLDFTNFVHGTDWTQCWETSGS